MGFDDQLLQLISATTFVFSIPHRLLCRERYFPVSPDVKNRSNNVVPLPVKGKSRTPGRDLAVEWFELHRRDLMRYARRILPSYESPEDLVQDVFYRLLKHRDISSLRNPRAFLMTATRNAAIDRLRSLSNSPLVEAPEEELAPEGGAMAGVETMIAIERALKLLPERQRQVFVLRRFKGMDTAEVAAALGISERMVQKHLAKAISHFHEQLGR